MNDQSTTPVRAAEQSSKEHVARLATACAIAGREGIALEDAIRRLSEPRQ
jgi:Flp pilus assembly protein TadB